MSIRRSNLTPEEISKISELRSRGMSQVKIGLLLGVGPSTVSKYVDVDRYLRRQRKRYNSGRGQVHTLVNGVYGKFGTRKRPRPDSCELCKGQVTRWYWHHWDDTHLELGMWLCWFCHNFVEALERGLNASHIERYSNLKNALTASSILR